MKKILFLVLFLGFALQSYAQFPGPILQPPTTGIWDVIDVYEENVKYNQHQFALGANLDKGSNISLYVFENGGTVVMNPISNQFHGPGLFSFQLDASSLPPGNYYLHLQTSTKIYYGTFVVK